MLKWIANLFRRKPEFKWGISPKREKQLVRKGYKVTSRLVNGSPCLQRDEDGVTHVIYGSEQNDYWYAEDKYGKPHQVATKKRALEIISD